jgi:hypothetical protein
LSVVLSGEEKSSTNATEKPRGQTVQEKSQKPKAQIKAKMANEAQIDLTKIKNR